MNCGLLGKKLSHSFSPQIHSILGEYSYHLFEKDESEVENFLKYGDFHGINVTIPYKKTVLPYCAELSPEAKRLGAVNTIIRRSDGSLIGHNSDYFGFLSMAKHSRLSFSKKKVLVLGSGGASNTVCAALQELGSNVVVISRTGENNYDNLYLHRDCKIIVNTTPVGMYPHNGVSPLDLSLFPTLEGVLDLIYNPFKTKLLQDAENQGFVAVNGLWMLVAQAKEASEWFSGTKISDDIIPSIYRTLEKSMKNLILIGMPGCGKSTVGKMLAKKTSKKFADSDQAICERSGYTIPEIFKSKGEDYFRTLETEVLTELSKTSGLVLATGGGCVTRQENLPLLQQNGTIIWIQRSIDTLATDGRPLSQDSNLNDMYRVREPLYRQFADIEISNNGTPEETADNILSLLNKEVIL